MGRDRRILLVPAVLLAAIVVLAALSSAWRERAVPKRAARAQPEEVASGKPGVEAARSSGEAASEGSEAAEPRARVHGVVTGTMGVLWCARVVAYRGEGKGVMAEAWTNPKGLYSLTVEPGVAFDLSVEPAPETGLVAQRRAGLALAAGEERLEDFALADGVAVRGRLVDVDGRGCAGIELFAVRPEVLAEAGTPERTALILLATARGYSGPDGRFRLRGLEPGEYSLTICAADWMFPAPVSVRTDGPDLSLVVVPALTIDLLVKDVETGQPVGAFSVTARLGDRVLLEDAGAAGVFSIRMPFPGQRDPRSMVLLQVAASGFVPPDQLVNSGKNVLWLIPRRDPNTTVRISFDDRQPYCGGLIVQFKAKAGAGGAGHVGFERAREGVYRGALLYGRWELDLIPVALFGADRLTAEAEIRGDCEAELSFVLPAGGTLLLSPPPGAERSSVSIRTPADAEKDAPGRSFLVPREGTRVEGIPPGVYRLGLEGRFPYRTIWFRDVRVEVGSMEEIVLPGQ